MIINQQARFESSLRRFTFEVLKALRIFWTIEKIGLTIKDPYKKLYERSKNK